MLASRGNCTRTAPKCIELPTLLHGSLRGEILHKLPPSPRPAALRLSGSVFWGMDSPPNLGHDPQHGIRLEGPHDHHQAPRRLHDHGSRQGGRYHKAGHPEAPPRLPGFRSSRPGCAGGRQDRAGIQNVVASPIPGKAATDGQRPRGEAAVCLGAAMIHFAIRAMSPAKIHHATIATATTPTNPIIVPIIVRTGLLSLPRRFR